MNKKTDSEVREIGAFDAKTHLAELLRQVEAGRAYVITRRGKPVAQLIPAQTGKNADYTDQLARMRARRDRLPTLSSADLDTITTRRCR